MAFAFPPAGDRQRRLRTARSGTEPCLEGERESELRQESDRRAWSYLSVRRAGSVFADVDGDESDMGREVDGTERPRGAMAKPALFQAGRRVDLDFGVVLRILVAAQPENSALEGGSRRDSGRRAAGSTEVRHAVGLAAGEFETGP